MKIDWQEKYPGPLLRDRSNQDGADAAGVNARSTPGHMRAANTSRDIWSRGNLARLTRFERATPAFGGQYSIQLSYGRLAPGGRGA